MDKLITIILPTDVWNTATDFLMTSIYFENIKFSKYVYLLQTFAKNIEYTQNKHGIESGQQTSPPTNIGVIKHMCRTNKLENVVRHRIFEELSTNGNLKMLKYLTRTFKLTKRYITNYAFRSACIRGHLEIVKYLIQTFGLTSLDIICDDNSAFQHACGNGRLEVIAYLIQTFEFAHENVIGAFKLASENGHLEMIEYLTQTFKLTEKDMVTKSNKNDAFIYASMNGHLKILTYLTQTFKLTSADIILNYALKCAGENGHFEVVSYLTQTFGPIQTNLYIV